jgi:hypothetical protein
MKRSQPKSSSRNRPLDNRAVIGWREWIGLPELGIERIKVKVDTGARSSALHAFDVHTFDRHGQQYVRFKVHPIQRNTQTTITAEMPVLEFRPVRSSTGHVTKRPVILVLIELMGERWPIELTLASRDKMGFRMLLGRQAVRGRFLVDSGGSYFGGKQIKPRNAGT